MLTNRCGANIQKPIKYIVRYILKSALKGIQSFTDISFTFPEVNMEKLKTPRWWKESC